MERVVVAPVTHDAILGNILKEEKKVFQKKALNSLLFLT